MSTHIYRVVTHIFHTVVNIILIIGTKLMFNLACLRPSVDFSLGLYVDIYHTLTTRKKIKKVKIDNTVVRV